MHGQAHDSMDFGLAHEAMQITPMLSSLIQICVLALQIGPSIAMIVRPKSPRCRGQLGCLHTTSG